MEKVTLNGSPLAAVNNTAKSLHMVDLVTYNARDLRNNKDYNFEYTVVNNITKKEYPYNEYNNGRGFIEQAERKYVEEVQANCKILDNVKEYLKSQPK
jgi:hypothetical protein